MLNTLNQLGIHSARNPNNRTMATHTGLSVSGTNPSAISGIPGRSGRLKGVVPTAHPLLPPLKLFSHPCWTPLEALLPQGLLPIEDKSIGDAALPLLEMTYSWLFSGMRSVPIELSAVLQGLCPSHLCVSFVCLFCLSLFSVFFVCIIFCPFLCPFWTFNCQQYCTAFIRLFCSLCTKIVCPNFPSVSTLLWVCSVSPFYMSLLSVSFLCPCLCVSVSNSPYFAVNCMYFDNGLYYNQYRTKSDNCLLLLQQTTTVQYSSVQHDKVQYSTA